jgi:NAD(P)H-dependent FMN reductase
MKKVLGFAGSTSETSINKKLVEYTGNELKKLSFEIADLNDFSAPLFSVDEEKNGFPDGAQKFSDLLDNYDGFIVSLAEHNGSYAAAFKNIFDWASRINRKVFRDKPLLLMATSPGGRGGATVLYAAVTSFPHMGAKSITNFSLPNFYDNFKDGKIENEELLTSLKEKVNEFENSINQ